MKKKIVISIIFFTLAGLGLVFFYNYMVRTRNVIEKLVLEKQMINILVAGSNEFNNNKHKFYSIVSLNPENNKIGLTFIPPSFRIIDDEKTYKPISEINFENDFDKIKNTFKRDLKLITPFYVELYSSDVEKIVDLIEGIDLFVLDKFNDISSIDFGLNYFDGKKIVKYINSVKENSIFLKYDRIQDIILTLYYNRDKKEKFHNLSFISKMFKSIRTNMLPQEIYNISQIVYNNGSFFSITLPGNIENDFYVVDDIAYKIYEKNFLTPLVIDSDIDANTKIKILNGTNAPGLARKLRNELNRDGLNVVEFGTSKYPHMKESIIINRKGNYAALKKVSETTGIDNIYHIIDNTQLNNVLIIIGKDLIK